MKLRVDDPFVGLTALNSVVVRENLRRAHQTRIKEHVDAPCPEQELDVTSTWRPEQQFIRARVTEWFQTVGHRMARPCNLPVRGMSGVIRAAGTGTGTAFLDGCSPPSGEIQ